MFFEAGEKSLSYSSNDDLSSLAVDEEVQMARFVAKTLRVCSRLVVLTYAPWTEAVFAVTGEVSLIIEMKADSWRKIHVLGCT